MCRALLVLALGTALFAAPARADDKKPEKPAKPQPSEPAKPIIIQIDASKLPPDVLKQLLQLAEKPGAKPGVKPGAEPAKPGEKPAVKPGVKPGQGEPTKPGTKPTQGEVVKPGAKAISLADAVAIAEKTAQGSAVKAERRSEGGSVQFRVEVEHAKGGRSQVAVDATGRVTGIEAKDGGNGEKDGGKGKKKKQDD
jgi:hypothetical protein